MNFRRCGISEAEGARASGGRARYVPGVAWLAVAALLAVFVLQASWAARRDSVTIDEFVQLPVGLYYLRTADFGVDPINPPLSRMIAASMLLFDPPSFAPESSWGQWEMGYDFMARNVETYQDLFVSGRTMVVATACLLGLVVFAWATSLYGWAAGLVALGLFCFSPSMLAHGHLITPDLFGAFGFVSTAWATWALLDRPSRGRAVLVGATMGVATLLKLSGFVLGGVVVVGVVICAIAERRSGPTPSAWLVMLAIAGTTSLLVLNLGYGLEGTFAPLSAAELDPSGALAAIRDAVPWLRLPIPLPLINGLDLVLNVGKQTEPYFFLAGELSAEGWWYYHFAAFALKTPIPLLLASMVGVAAWALGRSPGRRAYCLYVPVLLVFASNSLFNSAQIGVRHVLPVYPLLFIAVSPWITCALGGFARAWSPRGVHSNWLLAVAAVLGLLWFVTGTLRVAPRYLQYFNEASGGAAGGHRMLIDSNIDWGQDLIRLSEYMDREGDEWVYLAYFGRVHPSVYGVLFAPLEQGRSRGKAVVSASFLMGRPYFWYRHGDRMDWMESGAYTWLQELEPIARVGSMFVYELP